MNERFIVGKMRPMGLAAMISFGGYFSCSSSNEWRCDQPLRRWPAHRRPVRMFKSIDFSYPNNALPTNISASQLQHSNEGRQCQKIHGNPRAFFFSRNIGISNLPPGGIPTISHPNRWLEQEKYALTVAFFPFCLFDFESAAETLELVGK